MQYTFECKPPRFLRKIRCDNGVDYPTSHRRRKVLNTGGGGGGKGLEYWGIGEGKVMGGGANLTRWKPTEERPVFLTCHPPPSPLQKF